MPSNLIVGISGSASNRSYNTALLRSLGKALPDNLEFVVATGLEKLPFYTPELDGEHLPQAAQQLRELVGRADALFIATPEYNYSTTGLLKNAIDWLSRPYATHALIQKPIAILGASQGLLGTVRAQLHLRNILHGTDSDVVARPEVYVNQAASKFNDALELTDGPTQLLVGELVNEILARIGAHKALNVA